MDQPVRNAIPYFLTPYRGRIALLLWCQALAALASALAIASVAPVVGGALSATTPGADGVLMQLVRDVATRLPVGSPLAGSLIVLLLATLVAEGATYSIGLFSNHIRARGLRDWMVRAYEKVLFADYPYFLERRHGDLTHLVMVAAYNTQTLFMIIDLTGIAIQIMAILFLLWTVAPAASVYVAVAAAGAYGLLTAVSAGRLISLGETQRQESARQSRALDEATRGMRFLRIFETGGRWRDTFRLATDGYTRAAIRQELFRLAPGTVTSIIFVWSIAVAVWLLWQQEAGNIESYLPTVAVFVLALRQLLRLMASTGDAVMGVVAALPYAHTVRQALEEPTVAIHSGDSPCRGVTSSLEFRGVTFAHRGRTHTIRDVSFVVPAHTMTAIVGASGAGKSTIIDLLMRLYDPREGAILVDGVDLRACRLDQWRATIGLMSQEPFLFHGTIRDNIAMGRQDATEPDVHRAAAQADIHEFIEQLPSGYDTVIGDRGMTLSGGQRQRIALARALVRQPSLLLLDEATSAVDNRSELAIKTALTRVKGSCTLVVVAHKLASVRDADQIVVLGDGGVLERGTHDDLMRMDGAYAQLYQSQTV